jgi:hypothetical protein
MRLGDLAVPLNRATVPPWLLAGLLINEGVQEPDYLLLTGGGLVQLAAHIGKPAAHLLLKPSEVGQRRPRLAPSGGGWEDQGGRDGGDAFAAAGEAEAIGRRARHAHPRSAERLRENPLRLFPARRDPRAVPDHLDRYVAYAESSVAQQAHGFGEQLRAPRPCPAWPRGTEVCTEVA